MGQHNWWRHLVLLVIFGLQFFTSGCLFKYYVSSSVEQVKILSARKSIQKIIDDPKTSEDLKSKLKLSMEAQAFAEENLGFKKTKNYQSYVQLDRPYVSWIVSVAHKDKLEYRMFDYAFVGELPYKGYFTKQEALDEAEKFKVKNYDTVVRGATAYSTLGWFNDPILSTMTSRPDTDFVELILHESAHATLFIKNNADFNEQLASFLGAQAARAFFIYKEGPNSQSVKNIDAQIRDEKIFSSFLKIEMEKLKAWYKENKGAFTEEQRQARLDEVQAAYIKFVKPELNTGSYSYFTENKINNALLLGLGTYLEDLDMFEALYQKMGQDLKKTLEYLKTLKDQKDPTTSLKNYLAKPLTPAEA